MKSVLGLVLVGALTFFIDARHAGAATIDISLGGKSYSLRTINGSYQDIETILSGQAWFGDAELAADFATKVGDAFGLSNFGLGVFFAYESLASGVLVQSWDDLNGQVVQDAGFDDIDYTFAIETPAAVVPLPTGLPLLLAGLGALGLLSTRKSPT